MKTLFTTALGLQAEWEVSELKLDTGARRIDFEVRYQSEETACQACKAPAQKIHSRMQRSWRHLDFLVLSRCCAQHGFFRVLSH